MKNCQHKTFLRVIDFDKEKLGTYSVEQLKKQWQGVIGSVGVAEGRCRIVYDKEIDKKCLQVSYVKGKTGPKEGGAAWRMYLGERFDELYFQFRVKFPKEFNFVLGGKLPGVGGGSLPVGGEKSDETGFTARIMWRGEDGGKKSRVVQYVYYMDKDANKKWGEDMPFENNKKQIFFQPGKWHTLKTRIKMNTPKKTDGIIQSWFDNRLVLDKPVKFRIDLKLGIDTFIFTTFFGGSDLSWAPIKNECVYFGEFIISTNSF